MLGHLGEKGVMVLAQAVCATALVFTQPVDCDPAMHTASKHRGQFLEDVSRYLTETTDDPVAVFNAYKRRTDPNDPKLPYPLRKPAMEIPERLEVLWKALGLEGEVFTSVAGKRWETSASGRWLRRLIAKSKAKGKPRWIYRRVKSSKDDVGISIAKTDTETEFAIARVGSGDWDYFVYDEMGFLTAESTFSATNGKKVVSPAPLTCLSCHYDRSARIFRNVSMQEN